MNFYLFIIKMVPCIGYLNSQLFEQRTSKSSLFRCFHNSNPHCSELRTILQFCGLNSTQPVLDHSKSRLGRISDSHCIRRKTTCTIYYQDYANSLTNMYTRSPLCTYQRNTLLCTNDFRPLTDPGPKYHWT